MLSPLNQSGPPQPWIYSMDSEQGFGNPPLLYTHCNWWKMSQNPRPSTKFPWFILKSLILSKSLSVILEKPACSSMPYPLIVRRIVYLDTNRSSAISFHEYPIFQKWSNVSSSFRTLGLPACPGFSVTLENWYTAKFWGLKEISSRFKVW